MSHLILSLRRGPAPLPEPCLYMEGPHSLDCRNSADFASKLRVYLDDMKHLKFLDHIQVHEPPDLSQDERIRLVSYAEAASAVVQDIWRSLGDYEDSLLGIKNLFSNIKTVVEKPDVSHIEISKPFNAILIAAGPSLELEYENLRQMQSQALLVAVDACFKTLLKEGITPHVVVAIERDDHSIPFFKGLEGEMKSLLVCHATVKTELFRSYPGPIATALKYSGPFLWLPFKRAHFWTASSSAHLAYRLCAYWGAESIALVGQDLCFHPKTFQSHADVPDYPEWSKPSSAEKRIQDQKAFRARGNTINEVYTDSTWSLFARDYQVLVNESKVPTTNTSQLGMQIGNIPYQPLGDWIRNQKWVNDLGFKFPNANPAQATDRLTFEKKLSEAVSALTLLRSELQRGLEDQDLTLAYEALPQRPHFLELVLEVVFGDWVRSQTKALNADAETSLRLKREFIEKSIGAIDRVLRILSDKLSL